MTDLDADAECCRTLAGRSPVVKFVGFRRGNRPCRARCFQRGRSDASAGALQTRKNPAVARRVFLFS